jgi:hypothetical protein
MDAIQIRSCTRRHVILLRKGVHQLRELQWPLRDNGHLGKMPACRGRGVGLDLSRNIHELESEYHSRTFGFGFPCSPASRDKSWRGGCSSLHAC